MAGRRYTRTRYCIRAEERPEDFDAAAAAWAARTSPAGSGGIGNSSSSSSSGGEAADGMVTAAGGGAPAPAGGAPPSSSLPAGLLPIGITTYTQLFSEAELAAIEAASGGGGGGTGVMPSRTPARQLRPLWSLRSNHRLFLCCNYSMRVNSVFTCRRSGCQVARRPAARQLLPSHRGARRRPQAHKILFRRQVGIWDIVALTNQAAFSVGGGRGGRRRRAGCRLVVAGRRHRRQPLLPLLPPLPQVHVDAGPAGRA